MRTPTLRPFSYSQADADPLLQRVAVAEGGVLHTSCEKLLLRELLR